MTSNDVPASHDRERQDWYDLMDIVHRVRDHALAKNDRELQSLVIELGAAACRVANTETIKRYIKEMCGE